MARIDDIEFFGSRVDAGDIGREQAARLLAEASNGGLTILGARQVIDTWQGVRAQLEADQAASIAELQGLLDGLTLPKRTIRRRLGGDDR